MSIEPTLLSVEPREERKIHSLEEEDVRKSFEALILCMKKDNLKVQEDRLAAIDEEIFKLKKLNETLHNERRKIVDQINIETSERQKEIDAHFPVMRRYFGQYGRDDYDDEHDEPYN